MASKRSYYIFLFSFIAFLPLFKEIMGYCGLDYDITKERVSIMIKLNAFLDEKVALWGDIKKKLKEESIEIAKQLLQRCKQFIIDVCSSDIATICSEEKEYSFLSTSVKEGVKSAALGAIEHSAVEGTKKVTSTAVNKAVAEGTVKATCAVMEQAVTEGTKKATSAAVTQAVAEGTKKATSAAVTQAVAGGTKKATSAAVTKAVAGGTKKATSAAVTQAVAGGTKKATSAAVTKAVAGGTKKVASTAAKKATSAAAKKAAAKKATSAAVNAVATQSTSKAAKLVTAEAIEQVSVKTTEHVMKEAASEVIEQTAMHTTKQAVNAAVVEGTKGATINTITKALKSPTVLSVASGVAECGLEIAGYKKTAKVVGFTGSVASGALMGAPFGPPGVAAGAVGGVGLWVVGEGIGFVVNKTIEKIMGRKPEHNDEQETSEQRNVPESNKEQHNQGMVLIMY